MTLLISSIVKIAGVIVECWNVIEGASRVFLRNQQMFCEIETDLDSPTHKLTRLDAVFPSSREAIIVRFLRTGRGGDDVGVRDYS